MSVLLPGVTLDNAGLTLTDADLVALKAALDAPPPPPPPSGFPVIASLYGCVIRGDTGEVLFDKSKDGQHPQFSTTKLMTALVACQHAAPADVATMKADLLATSGESTADLVTGETMRCDNLMKAMLFPSGSDASRLLAAFVGGTYLGGSDADLAGMAKFVTEMNAQATALGMTNSAFVNTSGDAATGHYSSAYDLCLCMQALMECPGALADSVRAAFLMGGVQIGAHHYDNGARSKGQSYYPGIVAAKGGSWSGAGVAFVVAAKRGSGPMLYAALLADTPTVAADDVRLLLDYAFGLLGITDTATATVQDGCALISGWDRTGYWPANYSEGYAMWSDTPNAALSVTLIGKTFRVFMPKKNTRGITAVYFDGVFQANVDQYAPAWVNAAPLWQITVPTPGPHTIKLVCTGTKNAASSGTTVDVDYFTFDA